MIIHCASNTDSTQTLLHLLLAYLPPCMLAHRPHLRPGGLPESGSRSPPTNAAGSRCEGVRQSRRHSDGEPGLVLHMIARSKENNTVMVHSSFLPMICSEQGQSTKDVPLRQQAVKVQTQTTSRGKGKGEGGWARTVPVPEVCEGQVDWKRKLYGDRVPHTVPTAAGHRFFLQLMRSRSDRLVRRLSQGRTD